MAKLKLDMDALRVDSFEAIRAQATAGTVQAHGAQAEAADAARLGTYYIACFNTQQNSCTC
jgi:hypothetical protein